MRPLLLSESCHEPVASPSRLRPSTAGATLRPRRSGALAAILLLVAGLGACTAPPPAEPAPVSAGERHDLARDEALGGHTLARHVGLSEKELRQRLARERGLAAASTFPDRETAERAVALALAAHADRIERWQRRGPRRPNLALDLRSPSGLPWGETLRRGGARPRPAPSARVVLRARGDEFFVLTAYPTEGP
ncbi:MAG TPA: RNase A-like domain-containing protein [Thermoanaerobaculia bacterium]|nr:RNase A-like domain-containing protein [Thermoanaerobaculia bacterium]